MADDDLFEDDDEEFLAAWEAVDRQAAQVLREALPGVDKAAPPADALSAAAQRLREGLADGAWPYDYFVLGCEWQTEAPADDRELLIDATVATMSPDGDPGWPVEDQAAVAALQHADWAGAVIELVRAGVGAPAHPSAIVEYIESCPEIDDETEDDEPLLVSYAFEVVMPLWEALGLIDEDRHLTALGAWALPQALLALWDGS